MEYPYSESTLYRKPVETETVQRAGNCPPLRFFLVIKAEHNQA